MQFEKLKNRFNRPAVGWMFRDPDTRKICVAGNFDSLVEMCCRHRKGNGLEIPKDFPQIVEHTICRTLADDQVVGRTKPLDGDDIRLNMVEKRTDDLLRAWVIAGRPVVGNDVVVQRCEICQTCADNARVGCLSCKGIDSWIYSFIGHNRRTDYDGVIHACKRGGFFLMAGVHMPTELLPAPHGVPAKCWRNTDEHTDKLEA